MPTQLDAPTVPWDEFLADLDWRQGEHVTAVGPTGCGKTTLVNAILPRRRFVVALGTKPEDATLTALGRQPDWQTIQEWPPPHRGIREGQHVILWPKFRTAADLGEQRRVMLTAMREMFAQGRWCLCADELFYLCRKLRLTAELETWWTQGRSIKLSLVGCTQRPAHVPLLAYDQATHLFLWRDTDETNLRRIQGIGGLNGKDVRRVVASLPKHDVLYVNTRDDTLAITRVGR